MNENENEFENVTPENDENENLEQENFQDENEDLSAQAPETEDYDENEESANSEEDSLTDDSQVVDDEIGTPITDDDNVYTNPEEPIVKKKSAAPIIAVIVVIALAIVAVVYFMFAKKSSNPYNELYPVNPSGNTISEIAKNMNMSVTDFLEQFGLPADMPEDTTEMAAYNSMPLKNIASMYGMDFATIKEQLKIPDETTISEPKTFTDKIKSIFKKQKTQVIDENTPWGVALDEVSIGAYVGEENLDQFKEVYEFGDEVTVDTKYKDIKDAINKKELERMAEQEAANDAQGENTPDEATQGTQSEEGVEEVQPEQQESSAPSEAPAE